VDLAAVNHRRRNAPLFGRSAVAFGQANEIACLSESGGKKAESERLKKMGDVHDDA
jgi:hypothetical protein